MIGQITHDDVVAAAGVGEEVLDARVFAVVAGFRFADRVAHDAVAVDVVARAGVGVPGAQRRDRADDVAAIDIAHASARVDRRNKLLVADTRAAESHQTLDLPTRHRQGCQCCPEAVPGNSHGGAPAEALHPAFDFRADAFECRRESGMHVAALRPRRRAHADIGAEVREVAGFGATERNQDCTGVPVDGSEGFATGRRIIKACPLGQARAGQRIDQLLALRRVALEVQIGKARTLGAKGVRRQRDAAAQHGRTQGRMVERVARRVVIDHGLSSDSSVRSKG
jgi:hypothetical protein